MKILACVTVFSFSWSLFAATFIKTDSFTPSTRPLVERKFLVSTDHEFTGEYLLFSNLAVITLTQRAAGLRPPVMIAVYQVEEPAIPSNRQQQAQKATDDFRHYITSQLGDFRKNPPVAVQAAIADSKPKYHEKILLVIIGLSLLILGIFKIFKRK